MDKHFAPFIAEYTDKSAKLEHLAINCEGGYNRNLIGELPDLRQLQQLKSLKVEAPDTYACSEAVATALAKCPESLSSCYIRSRGDCGMIINFTRRCYSLVQEQLRRLTTLDLFWCQVHITEASITCLEGLTSLSIMHSEVKSELEAVTQLTNLVYLDLTKADMPGSIFGDTRYFDRHEPWSKFEAWPALQVFKFAGCWLIDKTTVLDVGNVQELHTDRLTPGMETASIHLVLHHTCTDNDTLGVLVTLLTPVWCSCIVDLRVVPENTYTALQLATVVNHLLQVCFCLQTLHLVGRGSRSEDRGQAKIVLGDGYCAQLKDLKLEHICCRMIDLGSARALTSISFTGMESQHILCELILPSMVTLLEFFGTALFDSHAKYMLKGLSSLAQITLGTRDPRCSYIHREPIAKLDSFACMPTLPGSLRYLRVMSPSLKKLLDDSAQRCLRFCTSLQHLTLPAYEHPVGKLHAWVKAARHVHILDFDQDW